MEAKIENGFVAINPLDCRIYTIPGIQFPITFGFINQVIAMLSANPYLHFNGNCEDAFTFYRSVFGKEFLLLSRYKDAPVNNPQPEIDNEKIMHVALPLGDGSMLMGSDIPAAFPKAIRGSNFFISLNTESEQEAGLIFNKLATDGMIAMPLEKTFWGAFFGMVIDRFGIQWMVNYDYNQQ